MNGNMTVGKLKSSLLS